MKRLAKILESIDQRGYKSYKQLKGSYSFDDFILFIDHVQGDPFASPSQLRIRVSREEAGFPAYCFGNYYRQLGFEDFILRQFSRQIRKICKGVRGTGKSGLLYVDAGGQEILKRAAIITNKQFIEIRMEAGLPARGRTILGKVAKEMLLFEIPEIVKNCMFFKNLSEIELKSHIEYTENFYSIQNLLIQNDWIVFIADNSILPRESGISNKPISADKAVPFISPPELKQNISLKNPFRGKSFIEGMVIPAGISVIVGGGFHGKSTLLDAIQSGIVPHIPGDGREFVVSHPDIVKIKAEDGRRVEKVNISPFITHLPGNIDVNRFSTDNASGSTSQAASILEAIESGARALLIDEDTSATNFMIRDARMQALVHKEQEPITPFIDRIQELKDHFGISTILVMGGNGDYLEVADLVIQMHEYIPTVVTQEARTIARQFATGRKIEREFPWNSIFHRIPNLNSIHPSKGKKEIKIEARGKYQIQFGTQLIQLQHVEQIFDESQTRAIGYAILYLKQHFINQNKTIRELLEKLEHRLKKEGLDILNPFNRKGEHPGHFAMPRKHEIAAALNRLRTLQISQLQEERWSGST
jgi:predicted ABC-class ATPase